MNNKYDFANSRCGVSWCLQDKVKLLDELRIDNKAREVMQELSMHQLIPVFYQNFSVVIDH